MASTTVPAYSFLSQPPPSKKKQRTAQPTSPLPIQAQASLPRKPSFSVITNWVLDVEPGSPAPTSPGSPTRRPTSRRPSLTRRRGSVTHRRAPSGSFLNLIDTPTTASHSRQTPSVKELDFDLTNLGYTSVFVPLPKTPSTPSPFLASRLATQNTTAAPPVAPAPMTTTKSRGLKHFRSLGVLNPLRSRTRSKSRSPPSPTKTKKAKYGIYTPKKKDLPPSLSSELALMQFMDGGSLDANARNLMAAQAAKAGTGVDGVYRDESGNIWRDQAEQLEFTHLLADEDEGEGEDEQWVSFNPSDKENLSPRSDALASPASPTSQDSDLHARYLVSVEDHDDLALLAAAGHADGRALLALPSRTRRKAKHLRKDSGADLELDAFTGHLVGNLGSTSEGRRYGKARRRPAPLVFSYSSSSVHQVVRRAEDAKRDFLDNSFAPTVSRSAPSTPARAHVRGLFNKN